MIRSKSVFRFLLLWLFFGSAEAFSQDAFVSGFEDLPLMDGLSQSYEDNFSFDTMQGHLLQAVVSSDTLSFKEVVSYYEEILPNLGWQISSYGFFKRETGELSIQLLQEKPLLIQFELKTN
jgi:hypothetical protein